MKKMSKILDLCLEVEGALGCSTQVEVESDDRPVKHNTYDGDIRILGLLKGGLTLSEVKVKLSEAAEKFYLGKPYRIVESKAA
jgi:hypothetical protein